MSRLRMPALACACALALTAVPTAAKEPTQTADAVKEHFGSGEPSERIIQELLDALHKQKVELDGNKVGELALAEGLQALARKHNVTFVLMEEQFKAKKIDGIRDRKSRVLKLDTKDMTPAEFLDVWLPGLGATYLVRPEYVEVVPMPEKKPEPAARVNTTPLEG